MTEKRFEVVLNEFDEVEYIMDKEMMEDRDFADFMDFVEELAKGNKELKAFKNKVFSLIDDKIKKIEDNLSLNQTGERKDYNWNVILAGMGMIDLLNNIKREYEEYLNE